MRSYRKEKVSRAIQQIVSEAIVHKLSDPRIASMTTVTRVEMTADLLIARIYISVVGDDATESRTLRAVRHATGYLQRMVAGAVPLRTCPELRFDVDERVKGVRRTMDILDQNRRNDPRLADDVTGLDAGESPADIARDEPDSQTPSGECS